MTHHTYLSNFDELFHDLGTISQPFLLQNLPGNEMADVFEVVDELQQMHALVFLVLVQPRCSKQLGWLLFSKRNQ